MAKIHLKNHSNSKSAGTIIAQAASILIASLAVHSVCAQSNAQADTTLKPVVVKDSATDRAATSGLAGMGDAPLARTPISANVQTPG
jgi:hypothetical protein